MTDKREDVVTGGFYELPNGRIAKTYGWNGITRMVAYYFDTDEPSGQVSEADIKSWKRRSDLHDFPNARDPLLPYVFDLHWDIKHMSELEKVLREGIHEDIEEIRSLVSECGILVDEALLGARNSHV
jgi:hypothetical protein